MFIILTAVYLTYFFNTLSKKWTNSEEVNRLQNLHPTMEVKLMNGVCILKLSKGN